MQKKAKKPCFGQFEVQTNLQRLLSYLSKKTYLNNFENAMSHVKFLEEFESFIRIQVRVKALPKNFADRKKYKKTNSGFLHIFFQQFTIFIAYNIYCLI